jgi:hypothetical protein
MLPADGVHLPAAGILRPVLIQVVITRFVLHRFQINFGDVSVRTPCPQGPFEIFLQV